MRVIVIGASSFIGFNFFKYLKQKKINTIGTYFKNRKKLELVKFDITKNKIKNAIKDISQKDIFIIFSAMSNPSKISNNKKNANKINHLSTIKIIKQINKFNSKIIFMSSVEVFDGKKSYFYENDKPNPLNYYGKTKLKVEHYLKKNSKNYSIIRTSWNSSKKIEGRCVIELTYKTIMKPNAKMAKDNIFSITYVKDLCELIYKKLNSKKKIIHISNKEIISRVGLADKIRHFSKNKNKINYKKVKFSEINYSEPRGLKNVLKSKDKEISRSFKFFKLKNLIQMKVEMLDKFYSKNHF
jgi:dTDP-4-dehydrorhamnose reductase